MYQRDMVAYLGWSKDILYGTVWRKYQLLSIGVGQVVGAGMGKDQSVNTIYPLRRQLAARTYACQENDDHQ